MRFNLQVEITNPEIDKLRVQFPDAIQFKKYKLKENCCDPQDFGFYRYEIIMINGRRSWFDSQ